MTTKGDMIDFNTARQRLGIGSTNQILQVKSALPSWETVDLADTVLTTAGDVLYENATPALARLAAGTQNFNLQMGASLPAWAASSTSILAAAGDILYASGANTLAKLAKATDGDTLQLASGVPSWVTVSAGAGVETGSILPYGGAYTDSVSGYLQCDGTAVSRTTYSDLFGVTSTQFGVGDGSSTFNLPDFNSKFARGAPATTSCGATGGADTVSLTEAELASHSHTASVTDSGHTHTLPRSSGSGSDHIYDDKGNDFFGTPLGATMSSTTGITVSNSSTGSGTAHENKPSYLEILYIIKT
jgi:microcystin-dependent protein